MKKVKGAFEALDEVMESVDSDLTSIMFYRYYAANKANRNG